MGEDHSFDNDYDTELTQVTVHNRRYSLLLPQRIDSFLDPADPMAAFPLWAKIWPASVILAEYVARLKPDPQKTMLELGAGLGLTGIVAASCGHRITLSEGNPDAVRFARASSRLNPGGRPSIVNFDWAQPAEIGRYDIVLGSEVVYREADIPLLARVLDACLAPGGQVVLANEIRRTTDVFFRQMAPAYDITVQRKRMRSEEETITVIIARMRPK